MYYSAQSEIRQEIPQFFFTRLEYIRPFLTLINTLSMLHSVQDKAPQRTNGNLCHFNLKHRRMELLNQKMPINA